MAKTSAGVLLYRRAGKSLEVFLVHPGGPFWAKKDDGAWSIPKGEFARGQDPVEVAKREFEEETGFPLKGKLQALEPVKQAGGKIVRAWALERDFDPALLRSNTFQMEWPPRSRKMQEFPEVDSAAVTFHQGMNITIVTSAVNNVEGHALLKHLGMPFRVEETPATKKAG